eukprot:5256727-Amphidinium_carterae.1
MLVGLWFCNQTRAPKVAIVALVAKKCARNQRHGRPTGPVFRTAFMFGKSSGVVTKSQQILGPPEPAKKVECPTKQVVLEPNNDVELDKRLIPPRGL